MIPYSPENMLWRYNCIRLIFCPHTHRYRKRARQYKILESRRTSKFTWTQERSAVNWSFTLTRLESERTRLLNALREVSSMCYSSVTLSNRHYVKVNEDRDKASVHSLCKCWWTHPSTFPQADLMESTIEKEYVEATLIFCDFLTSPTF